MKKKKTKSVNNILNLYEKNGTITTEYELCDYAQIQLLGNHAKERNDNGEGHIMLISKNDLNNVMNYTWYLGSTGYPVTYNKLHDVIPKQSIPHPLHRFLVPNAPHGHVVDHINRNRLDNRRDNLRIITAKENSFNRTKPKNSKNKYKGVQKTGNNKFKAIISKDGKKYELCGFDSEKDAAIAYDMMAEELFGNFAGKNYPD